MLLILAWAAVIIPSVALIVAFLFFMSDGFKNWRIVATSALIILGVIAWCWGLAYLACCSKL